MDECQNDTLNTCDNNADCFDTEGNFTCTCREGYTGSGLECEGKCWIMNKALQLTLSELTLLDFDECVSSDTNDCHPDASCNNMDGSFVCTCLPGFEGNGTFCTGNLTEC